MAKSTLRLKTYYGPGEQRLRVVSVEGGTVVVQHPLSLREERISLREMKAFIAGSKRRTYHLPTVDGAEVRTKIDRFRVKKGDGGVLPPGNYTVYTTPQQGPVTVPSKEWDKWRAKAQ